MKFKLNLLVIAVAMAGTLAACSSSNDDEYVTLDRDWDNADSAFWVDYTAIRTSNERLEQDLQKMKADSTAAAQYAQAQQRLAANRQALLDMENKRNAARTAREAARTAKDRAAYDAARSGSDYTTWRTDLTRIRTEQGEIEGMLKVGGKSVGGVDVSVKDTSKPLIRVEPGKEDNKPLIEKNKNP